jgi:hypothetical protein
MWYEYLYPRKVYFLGQFMWRWFNIIFMVYPKNLVWEPEFDGRSGNWVAFVLGKEVPYVVGPAPDGKQYSFYGPGLSSGYRMTMDAARAACERHYQRNALGINGIID